MMFNGTWRSAAPQYQQRGWQANQGFGAVRGYGGSGYTDHQGVTQGPLITQHQGRAAAISAQPAPVYPAKVEPMQAAPMAANPTVPTTVTVRRPGYLEQLLAGNFGGANFGMAGGSVGGGPNF